MAATAAGLKARYPEFATVADATVTFAIEDASRFVDHTWFETDRDRAIYALAAHILAIGGALGSAIGNATGPIKSYKLGDAAETYGSWDGNMSTSGLSTTSYGSRFLMIARANVPAVVVA
jgi:hypothetical protein